MSEWIDRSLRSKERDRIQDEDDDMPALEEALAAEDHLSAADLQQARARVLRGTGVTAIGGANTAIDQQAAWRTRAANAMEQLADLKVRQEYSESVLDDLD